MIWPTPEDQAMLTAAVTEMDAENKKKAHAALDLAWEKMYADQKASLILLLQKVSA